MPIVERTARNAFRRFRTHVRALVQATLPVPPHIRLDVDIRENTGKLEFVKGDGVPAALPLDTRDHGILYLTLTQILTAQRELTKYRLRTREYAYRLLEQDDPRANAVVRWEYDSEAPKHGWCRHHVQFTVGTRLGPAVLDLNRVHTPTGWVTIEELIRFLIHELGVTSPARIGQPS